MEANKVASMASMAAAYGPDDEPDYEQLFRCLICLCRASHAQLIPCCSKIVCSNCVQRWLTTRRQCPHCREPLYPSQLMNCPFVDETYEVARGTASV
jgi:hypothetical protein